MANIATHTAPVWGSMANFLIFADLSESGLEDSWEQLWAEQLSDQKFRICCIPFLTYGISLGDCVTTTRRGDRQFVISAICARSGRRVYRLWFKETPVEARSRIIEFIHSNNLIYEWHSENLLALDVASDETIAPVVDAYLAGLNTQFGLSFERGDV